MPMAEEWAASGNFALLLDKVFQLEHCVIPKVYRQSPLRCCIQMT